MKAKIVDIVNETVEVRSFRLKPEGEMKYVAGQWQYVALNASLRHHFTLSSSPTEPHLQFTTKFRPESEFKQTLWRLLPGAELEVVGAFGSFTLDENDCRRRLFVAGGIGITPFRSMLRYVADRKLQLPITLIYSNKVPEEIVFHQELGQIAAQDENIQVVLTITQPDQSPTGWLGEVGRIDEAMIGKYCPDLSDTILYACGPPAMVEAFVRLGQNLGLPPQRLKSEEFTGY